MSGFVGFVAKMSSKASLTSNSSRAAPKLSRVCVSAVISSSAEILRLLLNQTIFRETFFPGKNFWCGCLSIRSSGQAVAWGRGETRQRESTCSPIAPRLRFQYIPQHLEISIIQLCEPHVLGNISPRHDGRDFALKF